MSCLRESKGQECKPLPWGRLRAGEQPVGKRTPGSPDGPAHGLSASVITCSGNPGPGCRVPGTAGSVWPPPWPAVSTCLRPEVAFLPVCMHDPRRPAVNSGNAGNGTGFGASSPRQPLPQEMLP